MRTVVLLALAILLAPSASAALSIDANPTLPDPATAATGNWAYAWLDTELDGDAMSGIVELEGRSRAARGFEVKHVDVWIDDRFIGRAEGTTDWSFPLDTRRLVDGTHRIYVAALAAPRDAGTPVRMGWGDSGLFETRNAAGEADDARLVLYEQALVFTGAQPTTWSYRLPQDMTGLRVRFESADADGGSVVASAVVHYLPPAGPEAAKVRTWHATYGPHETAAALSDVPHDALHQGGLLVLAAQAAGTGRLRLVVEALPLPAADAPDEGDGPRVPSFQMRH